MNRLPYHQRVAVYHVARAGVFLTSSLFHLFLPSFTQDFLNTYYESGTILFWWDSEGANKL